ncbi:uncharacterized protein LOC132302651 [Cornus florida]|uniref:uncharacterized protein LOC132302651 n=1 Tax=Cornus florida TaxID=4283 RepID=UPI002899A2B9|nr:uncharacterized protein LOC132302651 [Cornus florida]
MMLHLADPVKLQTKKVVFEDIFNAHDSGTLEQLKELSSKRRIIEESINKSSFITEAIAREMSGGLNSHCEQDLQKLEQYLPLLENLVHHVDLVSDCQRKNRWVSDLKIRWSSSLSSPSFFNLKGPKFFQINSLRFELGMTLFLYGSMLREWALEVMSADLVESATLFRKAAGVYHYLAHDLLPYIQPLPMLITERPLEASSCMPSVMSIICLAEAQAVTIRKAEEKGNSGGLLSKLHCGITQLLDEATGMLHSVTEARKDVSARFVDFISSCKAVHELRSCKYLAEDLKIASQVGVAVGVLRRALINAQKNLPGEESWRLVFKKEIDDVTGLIRKYEHENEFVWREKIPSDDDLPLPQGKRIVSFLPYHPQRWERALVFKT